MENKYIYREFDVIVAEVLGYLLNKKSDFIIVNFNPKDDCHQFYYEMLKMCYSLTNCNIYYKTNWFKYIFTKIFYFGKNEIKLAKKNTKGYEIDFKTFSKVIEINEHKLARIYKEYYYNK
jgi:hypothetical protein